MTTQTGQYSYDEIPYPSHSFTATHPDHLATLATLLGMHPTPVEQCRVLELGCASGGNLVPMAYGLPTSEFVGIDLSARQITEGQEWLATLGLKNVTLKHLNLLDVTPDFGRFDYIIAHGVYSWVPAAVQDKVLQICRQNLAANGVAYVSYNTYPGWRMLGTVRDMMLYHTRQITDPQERATAARALLDFLVSAVPAKNSPHASFLNAYLNFVQEYLTPKHDEHLLHDELEEVNEPVYFYQFVEQAARHGLRYLAEADLQGMLANNLPAEVSKTLRQMVSNTIELEQYMDFLRNRAFRRTLLCHQDVRLRGKVAPERLSDFYVASSARPETPQPDLHSVSVEKFKASDGATLAIDHPLTKAAMLYLSEVWPRPVSFNSLLAEAQARLNGTAGTGSPPGAPNEVQVLGANLLKAFSYSESLVELHVYAPHFVLEVSECPTASSVARLQAQNSMTVTNMRHERVDLDEITYHLLLHLDGTRNRTALLDIIAGLAAEGVIEVKEEERPIKDATEVKRLMTKRIEAHLSQLARTALLVG